MTGGTVNSMLESSGKHFGTSVGKSMGLFNNLKVLCGQWVNTVREASKVAKKELEEKFKPEGPLIVTRTKPPELIQQPNQDLIIVPRKNRNSSDFIIKENQTPVP